MSSPMNQSDPRRDLLAYADGELDSQGNLRVLEQMAADPQAPRQVMHQHQLRQAVCRSMTDPKLPGVATPAALRAKLTDLAGTLPAGAGSQASDQPGGATGPGVTGPGVAGPGVARPGVAGPGVAVVLARLGRWAPAAVAAVLFLSALTTLFYTAADRAGRGPGIAAGIIPAAQIDMLARRHVACSRMLEKLMTDQSLPQQIEALPAALAQRLGHPTPGLDLSAIEYRFDRVGPCTLPGEGAVHLIYRAMEQTGRDDSLSLWIYANDSLKLAEGKIYTVADATKPHPILLWKQGGMVYYLVGDSMQGIQQAVALLHPGDKSRVL